MPLIYHEGYSLGDGVGNNQLLKDTVGWIGKNLLPNNAKSQTINGVTFTVNADGSVTANGTATSYGAELKLHTFGVNDTVVGKQLTLSGCPTGGGATTYRLMGFRVADASGASGTIFETGEGETFDYLNNLGTGYISLQIRPNYTANNLTFYPMLRRADILDDTYEPYHENVENVVEQVYADNGVLGAKNLLPNNATSQTINGVTVTVDDNKVITLNGTSTADSYITLLSQADLNNLLAKYGDLIINGSHPTEYNNARIITRYGSSNYIVDSGKGALLYASITYEMGLTLQIFREKTFNNHKIYPMLRLASDPDDTYQPYAMTNRELTEKKINIADLKTVVSASSDFTDFKTRIASL